MHNHLLGCLLCKPSLTDDNLEEIFQFAYMNSVLPLTSTCVDRLAKQFETIAQTNLFVSLDSDRVESLLRKDDLPIKSECQAFEAIVKWVRDGDKDFERHNYLRKLLPTLRWCQLPPEYIKGKILENEFVKQSQECRLVSFINIFLFLKPSTSEITCTSFIFREYIEDVLETLKDRFYRGNTDLPICLSPRTRKHTILGVGKSDPSKEATNAPTGMQVSAFDMYSGLSIPLGKVNEQEHCATAVVGSKLTFSIFFIYGL